MAAMKAIDMACKKMEPQERRAFQTEFAKLGGLAAVRSLSPSFLLLFPSVASVSASPHSPTRRACLADGARA